MTPKLRIMGIPGSKSCKAIVDGTKINRFCNKKHGASVLINYGLAGTRLKRFYRKYPSARRIPTINRTVGHSKLKVVNSARRKGINAPMSKLSLSQSDKKSDWIEKRISSQGGYGICKARRKGRITGKYYQKYIKNRRYELRVHGFLWTDAWRIQKRYGKRGEIAWNFNNGGHFVTVRSTQSTVFKEAIKTTKKILKMLGMAFGAADFIVDDRGKLWFIEINSCPGFQELSKGIYTNAFEKLHKMAPGKIRKFAS